MTTTHDSSAPGSGSLRAAITAAAPGDTVVVPASRTPYKLTLGSIVISHAITIRGTGSGPRGTVIEPSGSGRVFHVTNTVGSGTVTLRDLSITKGSTTARPGGGGILADAGALSLDHVVMSGNSARVSGGSSIGGGAIYTDGGAVSITHSSLINNSLTASGAGMTNLGGAALYSDGSGSVTISHSTISANHTSVPSVKCCAGGAIFQNATAPISITKSQLNRNQYTQAAGTNCCSGGAAVYQNGDANVSITASTLDQNKATVTDTNCCDGGGAIFIDHFQPLLTIDRTTLNNNTTVDHTGDCCSGGGAISTFAAVTITHSRLEFDTAQVTDANCCDGGGAVLLDSGPGAMSIVSSELSHNTSSVQTSASNVGLASCCQGGGAVNFDGSEGALTVGSSDLSDNRSTDNSSVLSGGGAIYAYVPGGGAFIDSTLSGNTATGRGGTSGGGALMVDRGPAALTFMTVARNRMTGGSGGGMFENQKALSIKNSIVALNSSSTGGANCDGSGQTFTSFGYNLENARDSCGFLAASDKVVPAASVKLGALSGYGGPSLTRELLPGSAAIDAVPLTFCTDQAMHVVNVDQRGVARPQPAGGPCDIGAYEFGKADVSLSAHFSPSPVSKGKRTHLRFTVGDSGPVPATDTTVRFVLPSGVKFVSGPRCSASGEKVKCRIGLVTVGQPQRGAIVSRSTKTGKLKIQASVSATEPDPSPADNTRTVGLTVKG